MTNALLRDKLVARRIAEAGRVDEFSLKWAEPLVKGRELVEQIVSPFAKGCPK